MFKIECILGCLFYGFLGIGKIFFVKVVVKELGVNMFEVFVVFINDMWLG